MGTDGGIWRYNPQQFAKGTWDDLNANLLQTHQLTGIGLKSDDQRTILEGSQDNGVARTTNGGQTWNEVLGGDGGYVAYGGTNAYATVEGLGAGVKFEVSNDSGQTWQNSTPNDNAGWPFLPAMAQFPFNTAYLMLGSTGSVWETRSGGAGNNPWLQIGPFVDQGHPVTALSYSPAVIPFGSYSVFAAFDDGQIFRMDYPGQDWTPQPWAPLPHPWGANRRVTSIATALFNAGVVYVTVGSFNDADGSGQVFRSTNYGDTWQDITGNLPSLPANAVALDSVGTSFQYIPYIGNDDGVYYGLPVGNTYNWTRLEPGLPDVQVVNLQIQNYSGTHILAAATHGRGAWETQLGGVQPAVTGVCEPSAPLAGGNVVTITGQGFIGTTRVSFGSVQATNFTVVSDTEITATVPAAAAAGTVDITVTTPYGTSATSSLDQFTYVTSPIRTLNHDTPSCLDRNDDDSTDLVDLGFTIDFFGQMYDSLYVNNNGNVTFDYAMSDYTPYDISTVPQPVIAPFWADVDTTVASVVSYGPGMTDNFLPAFAVNWINVGYYAGHADLTNIFQLVIISRPDVGPGSFDIEFNYSKLRWETGDYSGGSGGLGGMSARVGYSDGTGIPGNYHEFYGSGINGYFLDSSTTGLIYGSYGDAQGRYVFNIPGSGGGPVGPGDTLSKTPVIRGIKPGRGPTSGGTRGYLVGVNFIGTTAVLFGDTRVTSFRVITPGRIAFQTPPHLAGVVDVRVITAQGTSALSPADRFTYATGQGPVGDHRPENDLGTAADRDFPSLAQTLWSSRTAPIGGLPLAVSQVETPAYDRDMDGLLPPEAVVPLRRERSDPAPAAPAWAIAYPEAVDLFYSGLLVADPFRKPWPLDLPTIL